MDLAPVLQADFVEDADEAAPLPDESNENDESSSYNDLGNLEGKGLQSSEPKG